MFSLIKREWQRARSALWARPAVFCLLAVLAATGVLLADPHLPESGFGWLHRMQREDVGRLLQLVAGGMLTVLTVTMSVMMLVLSLVAGQASPRAVPELMADRVIQTALGVFLATFVFALTGAGLLALDLLDGAGMSLIGSIALALLVAALVSLLRLIQRGASVMKLNEIVARLHGQAERVLHGYFAREPAANGDAAADVVGGVSVRPVECGYVQLLDEPTLVEACRERGVRVAMLVREGDFVHAATPLMAVEGLDDDDDEDSLHALRGCVVLGVERSPEQDPLLGFALLAEVASRALSPGINDPQTAIVCLDRLCALLARAAVVPAAQYPAATIGDGCVTVRRPGFAAMLERALRPLMRDGAGCAEVQQRIAGVLRELSLLADPGYRTLLAEEADRLLVFATEGLVFGPDLERVRETVAGMAAPGDAA